MARQPTRDRTSESSVSVDLNPRVVTAKRRSFSDLACWASTCPYSRQIGQMAWAQSGLLPETLFFSHLAPAEIVTMDSKQAVPRAGKHREMVNCPICRRRRGRWLVPYWGCMGLESAQISTLHGLSGHCSQFGSPSSYGAQLCEGDCFVERRKVLLVVQDLRQIELECASGGQEHGRHDDCC